jgi:hypothetical protein
VRLCIDVLIQYGTPLHLLPRERSNCPRCCKEGWGGTPLLGVRCPRIWSVTTFGRSKTVVRPDSSCLTKPKLYVPKTHVAGGPSLIGHCTSTRAGSTAGIRFVEGDITTSILDDRTSRLTVPDRTKASWKSLFNPDRIVGCKSARDILSRHNP